MKNRKEPRFEGSLVYIPLSKGYEAIVDYSDFHLVRGYSWRAKVDAHSVYARRSERVGNKVLTIYMHRQICAPDGDDQVDHKDGDGLNNTRLNIRVCTPSQNQWNKGAQKNNTSGFKGVTWCSSKRKWRAVISANGKKKSIGSFDSAEAAFLAYCKASNSIHKEFSRIV